MNYKKLKDFLETKKVTQQEFANFLNMSRTGVSKMFKEKTMKLDVYEKIIDHFNLPIDFFYEKGDLLTFEEPREEYIVSYKEIIEDLRSQIKIKDEQLDFLQHLIDEKL